MSIREPAKIWRVIDLINWGTEYFSEKEFDNPRREIEWLLSDYLDCKRIDLYLRFEEPFTNQMLADFRMRVKRRINHEPLQYISGKTEFFGLPINVNPAVLIPRPETERLVETILETSAGLRNPRILEVGTGSGCIAVALAKERPDAKINSIDISSEALAIAGENARLNGTENIQFHQLDILSQLPGGEFDMMVSNPPYIPKAEIESLMEEVGKFEPLDALSDNNDGLSFYRRFAEIAPMVIKTGGWIILELGLGKQPAQAAALFNSENYVNTELIRDYNGDQRVLKVQVA